MTDIDELVKLLKQKPKDFKIHILNIGKKQVKIIFIYNLYQKEHFEKDLVEVLATQIGLEQKESIKQLNKKILLPDAVISKWLQKFNKSKIITYDQFKSVVEYTVFETLKKLFSEKPELINSPVLTMPIWLDREQASDYNGVFFEEYSTNTKLTFAFVGDWLVRTVALPYFYHKNDYPIVTFNELYRYFKHEFTHGFDTRNKRYTNEDEMRGKIKGAVKNLHYVFENLRVEGLAEFNDKKTLNAHGFSIEIQKSWINKFRKNVISISKAKNANEAKKIYEDKLELGTSEASYHSGFYPLSRVMAYTIALALWKKDGKGSMLAFKSRHDAYSLDNMNNAFKQAGNNEYIFITALPKNILDKAESIIEKTHFQDYIKLYEKACDYLKLEKKFRIVTWEFYSKAAEKAKQFWEKHLSENVKSEGFEPDLFNNKLINHVIVIGSSAGGDDALSYMLPKLNLKSSILILVPHLSLTKTFGVAKGTGLKIEEIDNFNKIYETETGKIYFFYGYRRTNVSSYVIDEIMRKAAAKFGNRVVGVELSGNGDDGAKGMKKIQQAGGTTFVQFEQEVKYEEFVKLPDWGGSIFDVMFCDRMPMSVLKSIKPTFSGKMPQLVQALNNFIEK